MTPRPRIRAALVVLGAALLVLTAVPTASAWAPQARPYRAGGAISLDTNLLSRSGATAWAIDAYLAANTRLPALGSAFMAAEQKYGVNARFLLAAAMHESGFGSSDIARHKHNLFGYNAYDRDPFRYATAYATYAANIDATARFIKDFYLTPGGRWWSGAPTLRAMQHYWSSSGRWGSSVSSLASSIRLAAFDGSAVKTGAPVVRGLVHGGGRAVVQVSWTGPALPAGVQFAATWIPVALDADVAAAKAADDAAAAQAVNAGPLPTGGAASTAFAWSVAAAIPVSAVAASRASAPSVPSAPSAPSALSAAAGALSAARPALTTVAGRLASSAHAVTLAIPAPAQPGRYQLSLGLRDTGGRTLPGSELVQIAPVAVRVWGDQAVAVALTVGSDGSSVSVRITNTGRQPLPVHLDPDAASPGDPDSRASTTVAVTATSVDPENPTPVLLLAAPLAADLAPGASTTFALPDVVASTGRDGNWLSVDLTVPGDPSWVAAYAPAGAWLQGGVLSAAAPAPTPSPSSLVGPVPPGESGSQSGPTASGPTSSPAPATRPTPSNATPAVPSPTPAPTAAPVKHGTTYVGERSSAIAYAGAWASAGSSAYSGGTAAWSTSAGASATLTFTGNTVTWIGPVGPTRGRAQVLIDGKAVATVNLWRSGFVPQVALFQKSFGSVARHTLTIRVLSSPGHPYVAIDGFVVRY